MPKNNHDRTPNSGKVRDRGGQRSAQRTCRNQGQQTVENRHNNGLQLQWTQNFQNRNLRPFTGHSGPTRHSGRRDYKALEYFELFFTSDVWEVLVSMTNLNANCKRQTGKHWGKWKDITVDEMKTFIRLTILMGVLSLPETNMYWQKTHWLVETPGFSATMSRDRYKIILRYLHVCDERQFIPKGQPGHDKLYKVRPFLDMLLPKYCQQYDLQEQISVDEAMVPWRGRLGFHQFIANKPVRFGIKIWQLSDSNTGYVYKQQIYCGANGENGKPEKGFARRVVKQLCNGLEKTYRRLFTDNFYTSVELYQELFELGIYACGTVRANRKNFPKDLVFKNLKDTPRGTYHWKFSSPVLAVAWLDNKPVYFLSTIHKPNFTARAPNSRKAVKRRSSGAAAGSVSVPCPPLLHGYNQYMGGVDRSDQMVRYYYSSRKTVRWHIRLLLHEIDITIYNAFVIQSHETQSKPAASAITALQFRLELAEQLVGTTRVKRRPPSSLPATSEIRLKNVGDHIASYSSTKGPCQVCKKKLTSQIPDTIWPFD